VAFIPSKRRRIDESTAGPTRFYQCGWLSTVSQIGDTHGWQLPSLSLMMSKLSTDLRATARSDELGIASASYIITLFAIAG
jgi:hypothetical protein